MTEHQEQRAVFDWLNAMSHRYPTLNLAFAIPNGAHKTPAMAAKFRREGLKSGVPDIFIPIPRNQWHGLFIEMKIKGNKPTDNQKRWAQGLMQMGYAVELYY